MIKSLESRSSTKHISGQVSTTWMMLLPVYGEAAFLPWYPGTWNWGKCAPRVLNSFCAHTCGTPCLTSLRTWVGLLKHLHYSMPVGSGACVWINQYIKYLAKIGGAFSFFNFSSQLEGCLLDCLFLDCLLHGIWERNLREWLLERKSWNILWTEWTNTKIW